MGPQEIVYHVEANRPLNASTFELKLRAEPECRFEAGQYASLIIPTNSGRELRRAYSFASAPDQPLELCVKLVPDGPSSTYLHGLRAGDRVRGIAPYGHFTYRSAPQRKVLFVATGTGIAPFRSMILSKSFADARPQECRLLLGIRDRSDELYAADMRKSLGHNFIVCLSRAQEKDFFYGRVTDWLRAQEDLVMKDWDFYLCGNGAMIREAQALLLERGAEKSQILKEAYFQPKPGLSA